MTPLCRSAGPRFIQFSLSCDRSHPVRRDAFQLFFRLLWFYFVELSFYSRGSCWRTPPRLDKLVAFLASLNHNVGRMKEWSIVVERTTEVFPNTDFYTLTFTIHVHVLCLFTNSIKKESKIWKASEVCVKDCVCFMT